MIDLELVRAALGVAGDAAAAASFLAFSSAVVVVVVVADAVALPYSPLHSTMTKKRTKKKQVVVEERGNQRPTCSALLLFSLWYLLDRREAGRFCPKTRHLVEQVRAARAKVALADS